MQVIASVAPFAVGFIGWQLTNNILERRRQEKAEEPPKLVDVPRVDEDFSFSHQSFGVRTEFLKGAMRKVDPIIERLAALNIKNVFLLCPDDPVENPLFKRLGENCVSAFRVESRKLPPLPTLLEQCLNLVQRADDEFGVDCILAYGGLSVIGLAKALNVSLARGRTLICIPTTYSGYEMTNLNLYTTKGIGVAPLDRALFNLVIYDLECTLSLPLLYTTASVITNLAHILEAWCNPKRSPITQMSCESAVSFIGSGMNRLKEKGLEDIEARYQLLVGSWMGGTVYGNSDPGVHHLLVHALGRKGYKLPSLHSILLPYCIQFNLYNIDPQIKKMAMLLGTENPLNLIQDWIREAGGPLSLKDLGVKEEELEQVVKYLAPKLSKTPCKITEEDLQSILKKAYDGSEISLPPFLVLNPMLRRNSGAK